MVKLQKSPRQVARRSEALQQKAIKLSPAEIRAANNAQTSKSSSRSHHRRHSSNTQHARSLERSNRPSSSSRDPSAYEVQSRRASVEVQPAPAYSPVVYYSKVIDTTQRPPNFSIPRSAQPGKMDGSAAPRVHHSDSKSSRRSLPTYRGQDLTQNGAVPLLQRPSREIVANPLSQFSRPRRSGSQPPADSRTSSLDVLVCCHEPEKTEPRKNVRSYSLDDVSTVSQVPSGNLVPPPRNTSPVSFEANQSVKDFSVGDRGRPAREPSTSKRLTKIPPVATTTPPPAPNATPPKPRFSLFKLRRHTLPTPSEAPILNYAAMINEQGQQLQSAENAAAARPFSEVIPAAIPGEAEQEFSSGVRCCAKCGRFKKPYNPAEFGMAPVLEDQTTSSPQDIEMSGAVAVNPDGPRPRLSQTVDSPNQSTSPRTARRSKNQTVTWPDKREEGKLRPPPAPPGITRFASLRGYTTEGVTEATGEVANEVEKDPGVSAQDFATDVNDTSNDSEHPTVVPPTAQTYPEGGNETASRRDKGDQEEPSWVWFYGLNKKNNRKSGPTHSRVGEDSGSRSEFPVGEPRIKVAKESLEDNVKTESNTKPSAFSSERLISSERDSVSEHDKPQLARPSLGPRWSGSKITLGDFLSSNGPEKPLVDSSSTLAVVGPSSGNVDQIHFGEGLFDSLSRLSVDSTKQDHDVAKGFEASQKVDALRVKDAERSAEIMAI